MSLNPQPTFPFCPEQTDFLCYRQEHGFGAIDMNIVEGFLAFEEDGKFLTTIHLTSGSHYISTESVPELVARFAAIKKLRYDPTRAETETIKTNPLNVAPTPQAVSVEQQSAPPLPERKGIWRQP